MCGGSGGVGRTSGRGRERLLLVRSLLLLWLPLMRLRLLPLLLLLHLLLLLLRSSELRGDLIRIERRQSVVLQRQREEEEQRSDQSPQAVSATLSPSLARAATRTPTSTAVQEVHQT